MDCNNNDGSNAQGRGHGCRHGRRNKDGSTTDGANESRGHLVLARKVGQSITIGEDVVVKVIRQDGGTIRLMISAPRGVGIVRTELTEQVEQEQGSTGGAGGMDAEHGGHPADFFCVF